MNKELPGGWFTEKDIECYRALVNQIPNNGTLVELGTWKGRSLCSIADIVIEKNLKVYAVDTFQGTENEGDAHKEAREIDLKQEFENNIKDFGVSDHVLVRQMTTLEAANLIDDTADMVFIDADHSEEAVYNDILAWRPKLKPGGRITGHDWTWESVRRAVMNASPSASGCGNVWFEGDLFPGRTFSVCFIGRNEAKFLPNALKSLEEFKAQGGEVCYLDTGSSDNTAQIARDWGCKVEEVGDKFKTILDEDIAKKINDFFVVEGEEPCVKAGESLFDFASARNYSANMATNEMIAWMDCDELYSKLEIDYINNLIRKGADQFEYAFIFSHDQYGEPDVQFIQSKFHNKNKIEWRGIVHEVLAPFCDPILISGVVRLPEEKMLLEHFQNPETNRTGYLKGLALDCYLHQQNDRNSHYFARELMWHGRHKSAIKEFKRHLEISWWPAERGQSMIYIGDCYLALGDENSAKEWYLKGFEEEPRRREALMRLAEWAHRKNDHQRCACYCAAALEIPWDGFYANIKAHYTTLPHELLYWAKWYLGDFEGSKAHYDQCYAMQPENPKYIDDRQFYYKD